MKKIILLFLILFISSSFASLPNFADAFKNKSACFILYNVNQDKIIKYNPTRCAERIAPDSTFKIPLSLMAFDQKIITQQTIFKWDGNEKAKTEWNQDQTPKTWLEHSVLWVSQELTPILGMTTIKEYLAKFNYGNQDFSGDPGKNDGLQKAWLSNSLRISADEQFNFLKLLVANQLPVSPEAMDATKTNMYLETTPNGWKLFGKTGSGYKNPESTNNKRHEGWFIGFMQKDNETYILVLNFTDKKKVNTTESSGITAENILKSLLTEMDLF